MKIQKLTFSGEIFPLGSFVLYQITGDFSGHCSAWYDSDGKMTDCEWIRKDGTRRLIPLGTPMYRYLESLGPVWK
jgi:hypothetical protein